jgi:uncharacterized lipoprotein YmbA
MMGNRTEWRLGINVLLVVLLAGCAGQTPRSNFYTLSADATPPAGMPGNCSSQAISVGPVSWPRYLDQPRIVTRVGTNRLEEHEFNRWGGSLEDDFVRTLIRNLSNRLGSELVVNYRRSEHFAPVYRLEIVVNRLDGQLGESVILDAKWSIITVASNKLAMVRSSSIEKNTSGPDYEALVDASSKAVAQLSEEIAAQLDQLCAAAPAAR